MSQENQKMIAASAMPPQTISPFPAGASSPMMAGKLAGEQQTAAQMALIGKSGGKRSKKIIGGNTSSVPVVQVPPVPVGAPNPSLTQGNYQKLTELAQQQAGNAVYDKAQTTGQTAAISAQQNKLYSGGRHKHSRHKHSRHKRSRHKRSRNERSKRTKKYRSKYTRSRSSTRRYKK